MKKSGQQEFSFQAFPLITDADWFVNGPDEFRYSLQLDLIRPVDQSECILLIEQTGIKRYQAHVKLPSAESKLRLDCNAWPPGVARLTIYSLSGILLARKNFRIIDKDPINFSLTVESSTYHPISKVKIGLQLADRLGKPLKGTFSMSVTTKQTRNTDIASIENLFNTFIPEEFGSERYREHILCYLDNTRPEVENKILTTNDQEIAAVRGHVLYDEKPLRKSWNLILMGEKTHIIQTAKDGQFEVPSKLLAGQRGTKWMVSVLGKYSLGYRIIVSPLFKEKDELLAAKYFQLNDSYAAYLSYATPDFI